MPLGLFRLIVLVFGVCILAAQTIVKADPPPNFIQVIEKLENQEKRLQNLMVDSEMTVEGSKDSINWEKSPIYADITAWFNGKPGSLARIDAKRFVLAWTDGESKYSESSYTLAFDGRVTRRIDKAAGPYEKAAPNPVANILPNSDATLWQTDNATGASYSIYLYNNRESRTLSQEIRHLAEVYKNSPRPFVPSVSNEKYGVTDCICVRLNNGPEGYFWYLDPTRSLALIGYKLVLLDAGMPKPFEERTIEELQEAGPGIWYPTKGALLQYTDGIVSRFNFRARKVVANQPDFDDSIFSPAIPPGYSVIDHTTGKRYTVATTEQMSAALEKTISNALAATQEARGPEEVKPVATQPIAAHSSEPGGMRWPWIAGAAAVVAAAVLLLLMARSRMGGKANRYGGAFLEHW